MGEFEELKAKHKLLSLKYSEQKEDMLSARSQLESNQEEKEVLLKNLKDKIYQIDRLQSEKRMLHLRVDYLSEQIKILNSELCREKRKKKQVRNSESALVYSEEDMADIKLHLKACQELADKVFLENEAYFRIKAKPEARGNCVDKSVQCNCDTEIPQSKDQSEIRLGNTKSNENFWEETSLLSFISALTDFFKFTLHVFEVDSFPDVISTFVSDLSQLNDYKVCYKKHEFKPYISHLSGQIHEVLRYYMSLETDKEGFAACSEIVGHDETAATNRSLNHRLRVCLMQLVDIIHQSNSAIFEAYNAGNKSALIVDALGGISRVDGILTQILNIQVQTSFSNSNIPIFHRCVLEIKKWLSQISQVIEMREENEHLSDGCCSSGATLSTQNCSDRCAPHAERCHKRISGVFKDLQNQLSFATGRAMHFYLETIALNDRMKLLEKNNRQQCEEKTALQEKIEELKEILSTTQRNYEEQISALSENLTELACHVSLQNNEIDKLKFQLLHSPE